MCICVCARVRTHARMHAYAHKLGKEKSKEHSCAKAQKQKKFDLFEAQEGGCCEWGCES